MPELSYEAIADGLNVCTSQWHRFGTDAVLLAVSPSVVEVAAEDAAPPQPARLAVIMAAARAPANSCFFFIVFLLYFCAFLFY